MESILEKLFYGNLAPYEKKFDKFSDYANIITTLSESKEKMLHYFDTNLEAQKTSLFQAIS